MIQTRHTTVTETKLPTSNVQSASQHENWSGFSQQLSVLPHTHTNKAVSCSMSLLILLWFHQLESKNDEQSHMWSKTHFQTLFDSKTSNLSENAVKHVKSTCSQSKWKLDAKTSFPETHANQNVALPTFWFQNQLLFKQILEVVYFFKQIPPNEFTYVVNHAHIVKTGQKVTKCRCWSTVWEQISKPSVCSNHHRSTLRNIANSEDIIKSVD